MDNPQSEDWIVVEENRAQLEEKDIQLEEKDEEIAGLKKLLE